MYRLKLRSERTTKKPKDPKVSARERLVNPDVSDEELTAIFVRLDIASGHGGRSVIIDDAGIMQRFNRYVPTSDALRDWLRAFTTLQIPRSGVCPSHHS